MGGNFGVDVFIIISGYYLIKNDSFKINWNKALKLWGQIFFYSIIMFVISLVITKGDFHITNLIRALLPVTFSEWWFASAYFVLYLIHPFINKFLSSLDKRQYQIYLVSIIIIWSIIPMLTNSSFQSNALIEFIMYYSIAGYIRLFGIGNNFSSKKWLVIWLFASLILFISSLSIMIVGLKISSISNHAVHFYHRNSLFVIVQSVAFFMLFLNTKIKYSSVINKIASATFGIYLIHDSNLLRPIIWKDIFKNALYQNTAMIIPYSIMVTILVFIFCAIIDILRQSTIEKPFLKFANKVSIKIEELLNLFIDFVSNKILK